MTYFTEKLERKMEGYDEGYIFRCGWCYEQCS